MKTSTDNCMTLTKLGGAISTQDMGRAHAQHLGFSASGACDEYAYLSANSALGNELSATVLELFIFTHVIFNINTHCYIFISGADSQAQVNNKSVPHWQVLKLKQGDELKLQSPSPLKGKVTYLAIAGGFITPQWLDSSSQNINEKSLTTIKEGDKLYFTQQQSSPITGAEQSANKPHYPWHNFYGFHDESKAKIKLRFIPTQLFLNLPLEQQNKLLQQTYEIKSQSNRMGYRLTSPKKIALIEQEKRLSKAVTLGTIQLPPDGQPIILMKDRQTIGGYPVLGVVIQTDLFRLSQYHAGAQVRFSLTSLAFAQNQLHAFYSRFKSRN